MSTFKPNIMHFLEKYVLGSSFQVFLKGHHFYEGNSLALFGFLFKLVLYKDSRSCSALCFLPLHPHELNIYVVPFNQICLSNFSFPGLNAPKKAESSERCDRVHTL